MKILKSIAAVWQAVSNAQKKNAPTDGTSLRDRVAERGKLIQFTMEDFQYVTMITLEHLQWKGDVEWGDGPYMTDNSSSPSIRRCSGYVKIGYSKKDLWATVYAREIAHIYRAYNYPVSCERVFRRYAEAVGMVAWEDARGRRGGPQ